MRGKNFFLVFMRRIVIITLFLGHIFSSVLWAPVNDVFAYNVADAIKKARATNEALKAKKSAANIAKLQIPRAFTGFLPRVIVSSQVTNSHSRLSEPGISPSRDETARHQVLSVEQEVFAFGKSVARLEAASSYARAAEFQYRGQIDELVLDVISVYIEVLRMRNALYVELEREKTLYTLLNLVEAQLENGFGTITDVYSVKAQLATVAANKGATISALQSAEEYYYYVVGEVPPKNMMSIKMDDVALPKDVESVVNIVKKVNPHIKTNRYMLAAVEKEKTYTLANLLPSVAFSAQMLHGIPHTGAEKSDLRTIGTSFSLHITVPILGNHGLEYIAVKEQNHRIKGQKAAYKDSTEKMSALAVQYWVAYQSQKGEIKARKEAIIAAQVAFDGTQEQFKHGEKTIFDLLSAQTNLFNSKQDLITTMAKFAVTVFKIKQLCNQVVHFDYDAVSFDGGDIAPEVANIASKYSRHSNVID